MTDEKLRTIEEICNTDSFAVELAVGDETLIYCSLGLTTQIMCQYQATELDHNNMYPCIHPLYTLDDYKEAEQ